MEVYKEVNMGKFKFSCENIGDPITCGTDMLKPCLQKYFDDRGVDESVGKREKQMYTIAFSHALERELLQYIAEQEEFKI